MVERRWHQYAIFRILFFFNNSCIDKLFFVPLRHKQQNKPILIRTQNNQRNIKLSVSL